MTRSAKAGRQLHPQHAKIGASLHALHFSIIIVEAQHVRVVFFLPSLTVIKTHLFPCTTVQCTATSYQYYRGSPLGRVAPSGNLANPGSRLHFVSPATRLQVQSTSSVSWRPFCWCLWPLAAPPSRPWRSQPGGFSWTGDIRTRYANTLTHTHTHGMVDSQCQTLVTHCITAPASLER